MPQVVCFSRPLGGVTALKGEHDLVNYPVIQPERSPHLAFSHFQGFRPKSQMHEKKLQNRHFAERLRPCFSTRHQFVSNKHVKILCRF